MEAWQGKKFVKVRVASIRSSRITFLDVENRNWVYVWMRPDRTKMTAALEQGELVTLLANVVGREIQGNKAYWTLQRVKVLR